MDTFSPDTANADIATRRQALMDRLAELGIATETHEHKAVFTVEEAREVHEGVPGAHCKNLFLTDGKDRHWLVTTLADRRVDLKALAGALGTKRLSFASPERLMRYLGVTPGSVTPFSVINDRDVAVTVILDAEMMAAPLANYHPLINTASTVIATADLKRFIESCGHRPAVMELAGVARE